MRLQFIHGNCWDYDSAMEWMIEYLDDVHSLYIKTRGSLSTPSANEMVAEIVSAAARHQCHRQIIDHRDTTFNLTIGEYYQRPGINQELGISRAWKIAMVFRELNQDTGFMETVFRNRGYNFREFADLQEAKAWICGE